MLKVLHTADWHLGHRLHGVCRKHEHQAFLSWLLVQIEQSKADALIIAGDIFDSANPPASAQSIFYDFLVSAKKCNQSLDIIIIGGNHDSASRLDAPAPILHSLDIRVVGGLSYQNNGDIDWQRLLVPITDQRGEIRAVCGAMPFIRNVDLARMQGQAIRGSTDPLIQGVAKLYQQLFKQMRHYKNDQQLDDSVLQIVTGHCYMVGTELSELSERRILGGNQHALPASIFNKNIDYVALGHLHKAQQVMSPQNNSREMRIQYSGSPIPLSFTERNYKHQVSQILFTADAGGKKNVQVQGIIIPRAVLIKCIPESGYITLSELEDQLVKQQFDEIKPQDKNARQNYPMVEIKVELDKPEPGLRQQIETMLEGLAVRLLKISVLYPGKGEALADKKQPLRLEELHPQDVFQQCYQRSFTDPVPESITRLFQQLLESVEAQK